MLNESIYRSCSLCPRECHVDRTVSTGFCGAGHELRAARAALHMWEEPCISGTTGSGTVFFSGCTLRCVFCQNFQLSHENYGKTISASRLSDIFLELQEKGAANINLVTGTQFAPSIIRALDLAKPKLQIPVVFNCGGYEKIETIRDLADYVDIWLPDLKYMDSGLSKKYSAAPDYFEKASAAIKEMIRLTGGLIWNQKSRRSAHEKRRHHPPYGPSGSKGRFDPAPALDQRESPEAPVSHQYHEPVHAVLRERGLPGDQPPDHLLRV